LLLGDKDHIPHNPPVMSPRIRVVVTDEATPKETASPGPARRTQAQSTRRRYRYSRRYRSY
jgi:hypothetical protein